MASIKVINPDTKEIIKEFPLNRLDENGDYLCRKELQDAFDYASNVEGNVFFSKDDHKYDLNK